MEDNMSTLIERLSEMNGSQIGELRKRLESKWGVSADVVVTQTPSMEPVEIPAAPTEFGVFLTGFGNSKMGVIKLLREFTGLGLLQAKEFVEGALPREIKTGLTNEEALNIKSEIEKAGGAVEVKPA